MLVTVSVIIMAILAMLVLVVLAAGIAAVLGFRFKKVFKRGLWALAVPPVLFLYGMLIERNIYEVNQVRISSPDVPKSFEGYRIVQISDLHLRSFRSRPRSLQKAVDKINSLSPDLVLFTGDIVTALPSEMDSLDMILSGIRARDGVFSVLGNHDYCIYHRWESDSLRRNAVLEVIEHERTMGWHVLMNENADIVRQGAEKADTFSIIGVENISESTYFPSYGDLDKAMEGADGSFKVLMSHDPTYWEKAIASFPDIDLTLSGHTHAMQLSLFGWSPSSLMFKEYRGIYRTVTEGKENVLYVNIGLGETAIPARIGTPPEITEITLHPER